MSEFAGFEDVFSRQCSRLNAVDFASTIGLCTLLKTDTAPRTCTLIFVKWNVYKRIDDNQ
jgi:hypothetical protein